MPTRTYENSTQWKILHHELSCKLLGWETYGAYGTNQYINHSSTCTAEVVSLEQILRAKY